MRILLTAPFVGEIGWELLAWQGRVRRVFLAGGYDRLVVLGALGKAQFYADMPLDYRALDLSRVPGSAYEDRRLAEDTRLPIPAASIRAAVSAQVESAARELQSADHHVDVLWPAYTGRLWPCDPLHQTFIQFTRPPREALPAPTVALVKRKRAFRAHDNWSDACWDDLRDRLAQKGVRTADYPPEAGAAIELLSACDLAVGQSTGGMHLAALCGCPAVVWAQPDAYRATSWQMTDRQRYQTLWNPLGTPVEVHGITGPPAPRDVADWVCRALDTLGRRTGSALAAAGFRYRWRCRSWIDAALVRRPAFRRWPWPVQKFVRYVLV